MAIEFKKIIAHKLNINENLPILGDACIDLEQDGIDKALPFFEKHIDNSKRQGAIKHCQFKDIDDNFVRKSMTKLIDGDKKENLEEIFIEVSRELALGLAKRIRESTSKSDGSLFVIWYNNEEEELIGILKMDPNDGVQINDDLSITVHEHMLPSINEKLHKSALIYLQEYRTNEKHLLVLDKQQGTKEPAQFFMELFLNAQELSSNRMMTEYVQTEIVSGFDLLVENVATFENRVKKRLATGERFDLDADLEPLLKASLRSEFETLDLTESIEEFKDRILRKQPDAPMSFEPEIKAINDTIFVTPDKSIEMKFSPTLEIGTDFTIVETGEEVVVTINRGHGHGLI